MKKIPDCKLCEYYVQLNVRGHEGEHECLYLIKKPYANRRSTCYEDCKRSELIEQGIIEEDEEDDDTSVCLEHPYQYH